MTFIAFLCSAGCGHDLAHRTAIPPPALQIAASKAPPKLGGRWQLTLQIPPGQPYAGQYWGMLVLAQQGHVLGGRVANWSNGARSRLRGSYRQGRLSLLRVDDAPYTGFRANFWGRQMADGTLAGSFRNDPKAPYGNEARGTWWARPIPAGSYHRSCDQCRLSGPWIACRCRKINRRLQRSSLLLPCSDDLANCDGKLTCGHCPAPTPRSLL